jgi:DNA-binding GntR family transcriptional regulator
MLFYNEILPGQKIKYKDLANRIGVSMTPVIQAIKWLEFRNIVRHETN